MVDFGRATFRALGTDAVVLTTDASQLDSAVDAVHGEIDAIDRACSRFRCRLGVESTQRGRRPRGQGERRPVGRRQRCTPGRGR